MSNANHELEPPEQRFELIKNPDMIGPDGPFFNHDFGPPFDLDVALSRAKAAKGPDGIVKTIINNTFPEDIIDNNEFQEHLHKKIGQAFNYFRNVVQPDYPKGYADVDKVVMIYDATDAYENCTLLHTVRCLEQSPDVRDLDARDAERLARILILTELAPNLVEIPADDPVE